MGADGDGRAGPGFGSSTGGGPPFDVVFTFIGDKCSGGPWTSAVHGPFFLKIFFGGCCTVKLLLIRCLRDFRGNSLWSGPEIRSIIDVSTRCGSRTRGPVGRQAFASGFLVYNGGGLAEVWEETEALT